MTLTTGSGVELQTDAREHGRAWQAMVLLACIVVGVGIVLGWLVCCAVSGCSGEGYEPVGAAAGAVGAATLEKRWLVENWQAGIYGDELCDAEEVGGE